MKAATQTVAKKDIGAVHRPARLQHVPAAVRSEAGIGDARTAQAMHAAGQAGALARQVAPPAAPKEATGRRLPALQRKCACGSGKASAGGTCSECQARRLQARLAIGPSNDPLEVEADQVAQQVLATPRSAGAGQAAPRIQRAGGQGAGQGAMAPESVDRVLSGPGSSLDAPLRHDMEQRFGYDFSQVRVHTGAAAAASARDVDAHAYTVGNNIVFDAGRFEPASPAGRRLLAHELTHVVQQSAASPGVLQRSSSRGAGGCGPLNEVDETNEGPRAAGRLAHTQIQLFLVPRMMNEVQIPRATKNRIDQPGCQDESVEDGFADLFKRGGLINEIGEIKPVGYAGVAGVREAEHYVNRADQSMGRQYGTGTCGPAGADDAQFRRDIRAGALRPGFALLEGVFTAPTVIGQFDGDRSRTLKAELVAPGAVGYWCTGGQSDTYTCGSSEQETRAFIDRIALGPAQDVLERFIRENVQLRLERALRRYTIADLIRLGERHFGPQIRQMLRPYLGPVADQVFSQASAQQIAELVETAVGPEARAVVTTLVRRITDLIINEMRVQLRNVLAQIVQEALLALCVGAPAVALAELLDRIRELMRQRARQLIPVVAVAVAAQLATLLAGEIASLLGAVLAEIGQVLWVVVEFLLRVLAAIVVLVLVVGAAFFAILAVITAFDPVPGDEVVLGAVAAFLARLIPVVGNFVLRGSPA